MFVKCWYIKKTYMCWINLKKSKLLSFAPQISTFRDLGRRRYWLAHGIFRRNRWAVHGQSMVPWRRHRPGGKTAHCILLEPHCFSPEGILQHPACLGAPIRCLGQVKAHVRGGVDEGSCHICKGAYQVGGKRNLTSLRNSQCWKWKTLRSQKEC